MRFFSSWMDYQTRCAFLDKLKSPADHSFSPNSLPNCTYCNLTNQSSSATQFLRHSYSIIHNQRSFRNYSYLLNHLVPVSTRLKDCEKEFFELKLSKKIILRSFLLAQLLRTIIFTSLVTFPSLQTLLSLDGAPFQATTQATQYKKKYQTKFKQNQTSTHPLHQEVKRAVDLDGPTLFQWCTIIGYTASRGHIKYWKRAPRNRKRLVRLRDLEAPFFFYPLLPGSHVVYTSDRCCVLEATSRGLVSFGSSRLAGPVAALRVCSHGMLETLADAFPLPVYAHFAPCGTRAQWKLGQLTRIYVYVYIYTYVETTSQRVQRGIERDVTWCFCPAVISVLTRPEDWKEVEE